MPQEAPQLLPPKTKTKTHKNKTKQTKMPKQTKKTKLQIRFSFHLKAQQMPAFGIDFS